MNLETENKDWAFWFLRFSLILTFLLIISKSASLAMIKGGYYKELARENKIFQTDIPAARGNIYDRKGRVVTESIYRYFKMDGENKVYEGEGDFDGYRFEGKDLAYDLKRKYNYGKSLAFVTGYIGKINEDELKQKRCGISLDKSSMMGRGGVEEYFDCDLRGVDGKRLIEVDAMGKYIRELGRQEPVAGNDINLSIDAYWQEKIYE